MNRQTKLTLLAALAAIAATVALANALPAAQTGTTSFPVLMLESYSARTAALADASVALRGDAGALSGNPAALADVRRTAFSAARLSWLFDTSFYALSFAYPLDATGAAGTLGVQAALLDQAALDGVSGGTELGALAAGDFLLGLNWGGNLLGLFDGALGKRVHLEFGIGAKLVQSRLGDYSASALAVDLGLLWSLRAPCLGSPPAAADTLSIGFAARNLSATLSRFAESELTAPSSLAFGFDWTVFRDERHRVDVDAALRVPNDAGLLLTLALEYVYRDVIALRAGYRALGREAEEALTVGFGLNFELTDRLAVRLDYATTGLGDLGRSDTFSLSVVF